MQVFEETKGGQEGVQNTDRHRTKTGQCNETPLLSMVSAAGVDITQFLKRSTNTVLAQL
jgi:hypothetical protein